ncbi:MAG: class I SAM-dependent methyltransferase [Myxococcales bacterium]|nr:class I SAM-dependent methyltransferase [Myxococcales bacterium]MCB9525936.1 class I SAM-dependent methyltransferase [Myxococcales bacterium]
MTPDDVAILRCPESGRPLTFDGALDRRGHLARGRLRPQGGGEGWAVLAGLPRLYREAWIQGPDRFMRRWFYDAVPRAHDPAVRLLLPLFQGPRETEDHLREQYLTRMALDDLPTDRPVRILEVSVGTGANLPRLRARLPKGVQAQIWGLDLSAGMVGRLQASGRAGDARLLLGDAHRLPFATASFDRVLHVGGINAFADAGRALAEMARVARPGTPIVVCDEQLDPGRPHGLGHRLAFKAVTFYDRNPHSPVDRLPPGAQVLADEQPSRFFYSLTWQMPG